MVIKFICPNGHQLSAPDERAGKTGKCPKCETAFVVPGLDELNEDDASDELQPRDESAGSAAASDRDDVIVFLCPNGHKLNGPASLKGRPGQCPHCGAKFVIPGDDEEEEEPHGPAGDAAEPTAAGAAERPVPDAEPATSSAPEHAAATGIPGPPPPPPPPAPPGTEASAGTPYSPEGPAAETPLDDDLELVDDAHLVEEVPVIEVIEDVMLEGGHPLAAIVSRFCEEDAGTWQLNIGLKDGTSFEASRFSRQLSLGHYAVFANPGKEDKQQVTIVAWDSIGRIDVQRPTVEQDPLFQ